MPVECADFLDVSDFLISSSNQHEIFNRAALGRAYYSVYHEALLKADELSLPAAGGTATMGEHKRLIARYSAGGKRLKVIAGMIDKMRTVRSTVDYTLKASYCRQDALKDIKVCKTIIGELQKL
ncbi:hypothetical protein ACI51W_06385 [Pseudomonas marginalis]|uniref:hypothetical protein n=1 Tax=Pseudomonas TaxID=286 RepID=UPI000485CB9E|nr:MULTISPECIES: hypothetical protein [unclassified Pseudomonas]